MAKSNKDENTYRLPVWEKIESAIDDYADDPNFKDQSKAHEKLSRKIYNYVDSRYTTRSTANAVDPVVRESNAAVIDSTHKFNLEILPSAEDINKRLEFYEKKKQSGNWTPEDERRYKAAKTLKSMYTDTAYIMPTFSKETNKLTYLIAIGADLYKNLESKGLSEEELAKAISFAVHHESMHYIRGDVTPWRKKTLEKHYKNIPAQTWNILFDTLINSTGLRTVPDTAKALLDHLGVRGATIPDFNKTIAVMQAVDDLKDNIRDELDEDTLSKITDRANQYLDELGADSSIDKASVAKQSKQIVELSKNLKEVKDAKSHFEPLEKKWSKEVEKLKRTNGLPKGLNLPERYIDVVAFWAGNARAYENDEAAMIHEELLSDYLDKIYELFPQSSDQGEGEQPNGNGQCEGQGCPGPGQPSEGQEGNAPIPQDHSDEKAPLPDDMTEELDPETAKSARAEDSESRERLDREISKIYERNGRGTGMGQKEDRELKYTKNEMVKSAIKSALIASMPDLEEKIQKRIKPILNTPLAKSMESGMPDKKGQFGRPKGVIVHTHVPEEVPRIVFAAFDESASVDDDMLAATKSAIHDICKENNMVVIGLSGSWGMTHGDPNAVDIVVHTPKDEPENFVRRLQDGGGTDHIIDTLLALPKLLKNKEWKTKLDEQLKKANVDFTADDIEKSFYEGKVHAVGITDGFIPDKHVGQEEASLLTDLASKLQDTFMRIVSWNPVTGKLKGLPDNIVKKLIKVILIGGKGA